MIHFGINNTNCTGNFHTADEAWNVIQTILLILFLSYLLVINFVIVVVTIGTAELRGCLFSMQLAASYIGNILGGSSLFGNDLYYTRNGIPPIECQTGEDYYFLLYVGISMNMVVLVLNTTYRYNIISSVTNNTRRNNRVCTREVLLKTWLPAWFVAISLSVIAVLLQSYILQHQFLISIGICIIPLAFCIVWNILISRILKHCRKNSKYAQRPESLQLLNRATFIIHVIIITRLSFLIFGTAVSVAILFLYKLEYVVVCLTWVLRTLYLILFTVEAHVYLYKNKMARNAIKQKILTLPHYMGRRSNDVTDDNIHL